MNLTTDQLNAVFLAAAAVALAAGGIMVWWRRRPKDPAEAERRRRAHLNHIGRIVEGHIVEINEEGHFTPDPLRTPVTPHAAGPSGNGHHRVVFYTYSISGVTYETAQDISGLEAKARMEHLAAGHPISVKYDPENPGNSILMADDWSGLH